MIAPLICIGTLSPSRANMNPITASTTLASTAAASLNAALSTEVSLTFLLPKPARKARVDRDSLNRHASTEPATVQTLFDVDQSYE